MVTDGLKKKNCPRDLALAQHRPILKRSASLPLLLLAFALPHRARACSLCSAPVAVIAKISHESSFQGLSSSVTALELHESETWFVCILCEYVIFAACWCTGTGCQESSRARDLKNLVAVACCPLASVDVCYAEIGEREKMTARDMGMFILYYNLSKLYNLIIFK